LHLLILKKLANQQNLINTPDILKNRHKKQVSNHPMKLERMHLKAVH